MHGRGSRNRRNKNQLGLSKMTLIIGHFPRVAERGDVWNTLCVTQAWELRFKGMRPRRQDSGVGELGENKLTDLFVNFHRV